MKSHSFGRHGHLLFAGCLDLGFLFSDRSILHQTLIEDQPPCRQRRRWQEQRVNGARSRMGHSLARRRPGSIRGRAGNGWPGGCGKLRLPVLETITCPRAVPFKTGVVMQMHAVVSGGCWKREMNQRALLDPTCMGPQLQHERGC